MNYRNIVIVLIVSLIFLVGCTASSVESTTSSSTQDAKDDTTTEELDSIRQEKYPDWTEETHSNDVDPNYEVAFPQEEVNRIDIVISEENWQAMMDDMTGLYGEFGSKTNAKPDDDASSSSEKPIYIETDVYFNDTQWYNVGMKFKGHSSLKTSWSSGIYKLPFKLDFDEFEDNYEELKNQRFYGFKKLSFASNFEDDSLVHEKLATEAFRDAGLIVPESAFYRVYVDYGEGAQYFGLYTAVENVDDTVIDKFGDDSGNVYEAEGQGSTFAADTYDQITSHFEKKNNEEQADWSDVQELSEVLNSDLRLTDIETWKENLEEIFDVDVFLKWLAINGTIQNWDTYGVMTHNFYLYDNPETGKLTWIPWDNNESFNNGKRGVVGLTANGTGDNWPLIRYLLDVDEYREQYVEYVHEFNDEILSQESFTERVQQLHDMIEPYVVGELGEQEGYTLLKNETSFINSVSTLLEYIQERIEAASDLSLESDWEYNASATTQQRGMGGGGGLGGERPERPEGFAGERPEFPQAGEVPERFEGGEPPVRPE